MRQIVLVCFAVALASLTESKPNSSSSSAAKDDTQAGHMTSYYYDGSQGQSNNGGQGEGSSAEAGSNAEGSSAVESNIKRISINLQPHETSESQYTWSDAMNANKMPFNLASGSVQEATKSGSRSQDEGPASGVPKSRRYFYKVIPTDDGKDVKSVAYENQPYGANSQAVAEEGHADGQETRKMYSEIIHVPGPKNIDPKLAAQSPYMNVKINKNNIPSPSQFEHQSQSMNKEQVQAHRGEHHNRSEQPKAPSRQPSPQMQQRPRMSTQRRRSLHPRPVPMLQAASAGESYPVSLLTAVTGASEASAYATQQPQPMMGMPAAYLRNKGILPATMPSAIPIVTGSALVGASYAPLLQS